MPTLKPSREVKTTQFFKRKIKSLCAANDIPVGEALKVLDTTSANFYQKVRSGSITLAEAVKLLDYLNASDEDKLEVLNFKQDFKN